MNALIVLGIILAFVVAGTLVWVKWSQGSRTAVDEAHEAVVQPVGSVPNGGAPAKGG